MSERIVRTASSSIAHGDTDGAQLAVLRLLEKRPDMSQRELSQALGVSLGRAHYVLRALVDKGLVKTQNFRRSNNKLAYAYILTPRGLREKFRLARLFLARKEFEFEELRRAIAALRGEISAAEP
ncbi:MAG: MarR family EPS-associated transcriptional regulator [Piscinibacter sp.]|nr:MarR family EPS-associated transcriptional regulator [Piscinibacter sp.]